MSPIRLPKLEKFTSKIGKFRRRLSRKTSPAQGPRKHRSLQIDPLEERQLLSLAPADWQDTLVNNPLTLGEAVPGDPAVFEFATSGGVSPYNFFWSNAVSRLNVPYSDPVTGLVYEQFLIRPGDPETATAKSLAADNDGDFVATWTRTDVVLQLQTNPDGTVVLIDDPNTPNPFDGIPVYATALDTDTGGAMVDRNVYARYFTDEVQRITLPADVLDNTLAANARLSLTYGGPEVQKLSITAGWQPFSFGQSNISGQFEVGFDSDLDGLEPTERAVVEFSETDMAGNAARLQQALRAIPVGAGDSSSVKVSAINPHEYVIEFGANTAGINQPLIQIPTDTVSFTSGFFPAVLPSTVREPRTVSNIPISPTNPQSTASAIETFFAQNATNIPIGPINYPPADRAGGAQGPRATPEILRTPIPRVTVIPVLGVPGFADGTVFDIHFTGPDGKKDHPELIVSALTDEFGNTRQNPADPLSPTLASLAGLRTVKEPSAEFRVNPVERDDEFTFLPDVFDQTDPVVAMDPDGGFIVTWQSEISDAESRGSFSDIYARQFLPIGLTDVLDPASPGYDATMADDLGVVTNGIRSLVAADAQIVQLLTIDVASSTAGPNEKFRLRVGTEELGRETEDIAFDRTDLAGVADDIRVALEDLGYKNVSVVRVSSSDPYKFLVKYDGSYGTQLGKDQFALHYVDVLHPDTLLPLLDATGTVANETAEYYTFRVNDDRVNPQFSPSIDMDHEGNFVIAWANGGQNLSYFNSIKMQRYNRQGERVGGQVLVTDPEDTAIHIDPFVAMSHDGNAVVTWRRTVDPNYFAGNTTVFSVLFSAYSPTNTVLLARRGSTGASPPTAAFDLGNNFIITSSALFETDPVPNSAFGSEGQMYRLFDAAGNPSGAQIRPPFRINSARVDTTGSPLWPASQFGSDPGLDADGDLTISYEGYGADASQDVGISGSLFSSLINGQRNADLLPYFNPAFDSFSFFFSSSTDSDSNGDIDGTMDDILYQAYNQMTLDGLSAADRAEKIGRLRAVLETVAGLLRGEANGAMYSQWDTDPLVQGTLTTLYSDSILNATRDGRNTRYLISLPLSSRGGNFTVRLSRDTSGGFEDIAITPVWFANNGPLNSTATRDAIDNALENAVRLGTQWTENQNYFQDTGEDPTDVRVVSSAEINARQGTPWDTGLDPLNYLTFEVIFQGSAHDTGIFLSVAPGGGDDLTPTGTPSPIIQLNTDGDNGTEQTEVSLEMEPDGDFVSLWTQLEERTSTATSNTNLYYRRFDESTDTAGPRLIDLVSHYGEGIPNGDTITGPVQYIVLTFDENMLAVDPDLDADSILNPKNFKLFHGGAEVPEGVTHVQFGLNKAAELAGTLDPFGGTYNLSPVPSNRWEAVLVLDGNGFFEDLTQLDTGDYTIQALVPQPLAGISGL
ncbi:MAG: hypothetical protein HUU20_12830, partial [Pirellulales bacterium]|nr:hypothetical protein [Pirellulales bacterium]